MVKGRPLEWAKGKKEMRTSKESHWKSKIEFQGAGRESHTINYCGQAKDLEVSLWFSPFFPLWMSIWLRSKIITNFCPQSLQATDLLYNTKENYCQFFFQVHHGQYALGRGTPILINWSIYVRTFSLMIALEANFILKFWALGPGTKVGCTLFSCVCVCVAVWVVKKCLICVSTVDKLVEKSNKDSLKTRQRHFRTCKTIRW